MSNRKDRVRRFNGMSYREVQNINSENRKKLKKEDQKWLKENGYKNVGWNNVISLHEKLENFLVKDKLDDLSIEELFLEADRIGNKYQTLQEIEKFNQKLAKEVEQFSDEIDKQFPDTELEISDFSTKVRKNKRKNKNRSR